LGGSAFTQNVAKPCLGCNGKFPGLLLNTEDSSGKTKPPQLPEAILIFNVKEYTRDIKLS